MSDIDSFLELINPDALLPKQEQYERTYNLLLEEPKNKSVITIRNVPNDSIAFRLDDYFPAPCIFNGKHHERKRADYIIISCCKGQKHIVIIEMKVANSSYSYEIMDQLRGGKCFLFYCQSILGTFWNNSDFNLEEYMIHYVAFKTGIKKIPKKENRSPNTTVENFLPIWGQKSILFNHLL